MGRLRKLPALDQVSVERLSSLIFGGGVHQAVRQSMTDQVEGRTVLVTGAGGSIGGALCRRLAQLDPAKVVMVDISENGLYQTHKSVGFDARFLSLMGDIRNYTKMAALFTRHAPHLVIHAAALKQVPMLEDPDNFVEAVSTNIIGTDIIAGLALRAAAKFVLVSTDKAVNPSSVLGLTKRVAELMVTSRWSHGVHSIVRFGNVMNSNGSAIPLFREQIERGGPVTITDRRMTRYMMTLGQAVDLILASFALPPQLHVLDMGEPIRILDLARMLIRMADKEPLEDIAIDEIGIRPGEKLDEELFYPDEQPKVKQLLPGIMSAPFMQTAALPFLGALLEDHQSAPRQKSLLEAIVPDYRGTWQL